MSSIFYISDNRTYMLINNDLRYSVTKYAATLNECGIDAYFPILRTVCSLEEAMNTENAAENLSDTVEQVFRVVKFIIKEDYQC